MGVSSGPPNTQCVVPSSASNQDLDSIAHTDEHMEYSQSPAASSTYLSLSRSSSTDSSWCSNGSDSGSLESWNSDSEASWLASSRAPAAVTDKAGSRSASPTRGASYIPQPQSGLVTELPPLLILDQPAPPPPLITALQGPAAALVRGDTVPDPPASVIDLTRQIRTSAPHAFAHGGFSDIHWGEWERPTKDGQTSKVRAHS